MRRYAAEDEERVRLQGLVQAWTDEGLLDAKQGATLGAALRVELRRTNPFLRAGLALFTAVIVAAFVLLVIESLSLNDRSSIAVVAALSGVACIAAAEFLVASYRCYRFGVEEMFAVAAVVLFAIGGVETIDAPRAAMGWLPDVVGLLIGTAGALGLYLRFGFVYAALGSMVCVAAIPFQFDLPPVLQRFAAAVICGSVFIVARSGRRRLRDDFPGDEYGVLQAAALAAVYVVSNVQLSPGSYRVEGLPYWCTYGLTWLLPIVGVRLGIRDRDRELMDVGLVLAVITLVTSKPYLGWARNTWDPIVFGMALIGVAVAVRRWIERGSGGDRYGVTLDPGRDALPVLTIASALGPPVPGSGPPTPHGDPPAPAFGGGRSGGAGGGDRF